MNIFFQHGNFRVDMSPIAPPFLYAPDQFMAIPKYRCKSLQFLYRRTNLSHFDLR